MGISSLIYKHMIKALGKVIDRGCVPLPKNENPIVTNQTAKLSFIALGDPQISALSPLRSARLYSACKDIKNIIGKQDALILLGDLTEYGSLAEYEALKYILSPILNKFDRFYAVSGNHDVRLRRYKKQVEKFSYFLSSIKNGVANPRERYYFSSEINGYSFILLGADKTCFEASYISPAQLEWLKKELDKADESKPVFVFNHQPLKNTNGLPDSWLGKGDRRGSVGNESDKLRAVLEKRKNVIFITGHLHYGTSEYTFHDLGNVKAISVPTVGVLNHGKFDELEQGLVFSVYEDKIVCKSRLFGKGQYVDKNIVNSEFIIPIENN